MFSITSISALCAVLVLFLFRVKYRRNCSRFFETWTIQNYMNITHNMLTWFMILCVIYNMHVIFNTHNIHWENILWNFRHRFISYFILLRSIPQHCWWVSGNNTINEPTLEVPRIGGNGFWMNGIFWSLFSSVEIVQFSKSSKMLSLLQCKKLA